MKGRAKRTKRSGTKPKHSLLSVDQSRSDSVLSTQHETAQDESDVLSRRSAVTRLLGVDELAILFRCSTEKIKRLARAGKLPAFKFGKAWFVREQDLQRYIDRALASRSQH